MAFAVLVFAISQLSLDYRVALSANCCSGWHCTSLTECQRLTLWPAVTYQSHTTSRHGMQTLRDSKPETRSGSTSGPQLTSTVPWTVSLARAMNATMVTSMITGATLHAVHASSHLQCVWMKLTE